MSNFNVLEKIDKDVFSRKDIKKVIGNTKERGNNVRTIMESFLLNKEIIRTGRDRYIKTSNLKNKTIYNTILSNDAKKLIKEISKKYPYIKFQVWELRSLNEFLNHLVGKNYIFIDVEKEGCEFVYNHLKEKYNGRLLLKPNEKELTYYLSDNAIIVDNLISETPKNSENIHIASLEKIIVDLFAEKRLSSMLSKGDYPDMIERMFSKYMINELKLFRYARRRNRENEIIDYIKKNTNIKLIEEG